MGVSRSRHKNTKLVFPTHHEIYKTTGYQDPPTRALRKVNQLPMCAGHQKDQICHNYIILDQMLMRCGISSSYSDKKVQPVGIVLSFALI